MVGLASKGELPMASYSNSMQRAQAKAPDPLLAHIGSRLRDRRVLLGITAAQLGTTIGESEGQIERFESGANRITPVVLYEISQFLHVSVAYFYQNDAGPTLSRDHTAVADIATFRAARQAALAPHAAASAEFSMILEQITDPTVRDCLIAFMHSLIPEPAAPSIDPAAAHRRDGATQNAINTQALFIRLADIGQGL